MTKKLPEGRTKDVRTRVTQNEYKAVQDVAKRGGVSVSELLRSLMVKCVNDVPTTGR